MEGYPAVLKMKIQSGDGVGDDGNDNDADDVKPLEVEHQVSHYQRSELSLRFSRQLVAP